MYEWKRLAWTDVRLDLKCRVTSNGKVLVFPYEAHAKHEGGVYVFIVAIADNTQQVIYVGQTNDLHERMGDYARGTFPTADPQEKRVAEILLSYIHSSDRTEFYVASADRYRCDESDPYIAESETHRLALEGMLVLEFMAEGYEVINAAVLNDEQRRMPDMWK